MNSPQDRVVTIIVGGGLAAAALLLYAMSSARPHPYEFYQVGRFVVCIAWLLLAWRVYPHPLWLLAATVALLFNPFMPIRMHRAAWARLDVPGALASGIAAAMTFYRLRVKRLGVKTRDG
jgi:hypothetical protein